MTVALLVLDYAPKKLVSNQGRTETLKRGGGGENKGGGHREKFSFCEILTKMYQKGGGRGTSPPPPSVRLCIPC